MELKSASSEWHPKGTTSRPVKALRQRSVKKAMVTVFYDQSGTIMCEFAPPGSSINTESYLETLRHLKENIRQKCPGMWKGGIEGQTDRDFLLHHDNASSHTSTLTLALIGESGINMLAHPPYSPNLAPCDFFLFPRLKNELRGRRFANLDLLKAAVRSTLRKIPPADYRDSILSMPVRWMKCVKAEGKYFEGHHLDVDPDDFGIQFIFDHAESSQESSESDEED